MMKILAASLLFAMPFLAPSANADEYDEFAHPICAPELGYFRLQRIGIYNLKGRVNFKTLREKRGIVMSHDLKVQPYICNIRGLPYRNKLGNDSWRPAINVAVKGTRFARIDILVNGEKVEEVVLGGDRVLEEIDSVSVYYNGVGLEVRTCIEKELPGPERTLCTPRLIQKAEMESAKQASIDAEQDEIDGKRSR